MSGMCLDDVGKKALSSRIEKEGTSERKAVVPLCTGCGHDTSFDCGNRQMVLPSLGHVSSLQAGVSADSHRDEPTASAAAWPSFSRSWKGLSVSIFELSCRALDFLNIFGQG